jgi:hypothetical protein
MNISWNQLENNSSSKELSFESFCFQIAYKKYHTYGNFDNFYNTAGSEFYLELSKNCDELNAKVGDVIGWQAKFWKSNRDEEHSPLDKKHRNELEEGLKKSIRDRPELKHWIICTPGKFPNNNPYYPWDNLIKGLKTINSNVTIGRWHKDIFEAIYHLNPEAFSSIFNQYFNTKFVGIDFINSYSRHNLTQLERKYDVDLHVQDRNEHTILSSIYLDKGKSKILNQIKLLVDLIEEINKDCRLNLDDFKDLSKEFITLAKEFLGKHIGVIKKVEDLSRNTPGILKLANLIQFEIKRFFDDIENQRIELNKYLSVTINKPNSKQIDYQDEDWISFVLESVNNIRDLLIAKESGDSLLLYTKRVLLKDIHVFGAAGYGKTHFACSIAYQLIKENVPVLLLLGSTFKNNLPPKERILQHLELNGNFTFKQFLGALDNLGFLNNIKVPIIIDGLNESSPTASDVWNKEIYSIIDEVSKLSNLLLITTCREKSEYIQQIFDRSSYSDIKNHIYLKGFTDKNIDHAIDKYFAKYDITARADNYDKSLFKNPLRLKIFSEVNTGKKNIEINIHSIVQSIESYIEFLSINIATSKNSIDKLKYNKLEKGLNNLGNLLWAKHSREVLLYEDFRPIFDQGKVEWYKSLTFQLIDEGICFQRDLEKSNELVQFTYDLVGGYQIAKSVFFSESDSAVIIKKLQSQETREKLLNLDNSKRHPLHEDILKSISYLLPQKIGKQIYEVYDDSSILLESLDNLELIAFNEAEKKKLIAFISSKDLDSEIISKLLHRLYDDVLQRHNFSTFDLIENLFISLSQFEIDTYWCELIREDSYKLQCLLEMFLSKSDDLDDSIYNVMLFIALLTASTDKLLRNKATKTLMLLGLKYPNDLLELTRSLQLVNDGFICESIICSLTGTTLRLKNKDYSAEVIGFLSNDFLKKNTTNHVVILDYIKTICDFAKANYGISFDNNIFDRNKNEIWTIESTELEAIEKKSPHYFSYEMMDYDFIKLNIESLSRESDQCVNRFSKSEIMAMLIRRIKLKGYEKGRYEELERQLSGANKYRRENISENIVNYSLKYLSMSFLELAGYLMINGQIKPEFDRSLRFEYVFYDPTFPELPSKIQILNECFLPAYNQDIQEWVLQDSSGLLDNIYSTVPVFEEREMILISASLNQKDESNKTRLFIDVNSYISKNEMRKKALEMVSSDYFGRSNEHFHMFSGEIPWSNIFESEEESYNSDFSLEEFLPLISHYSWSSWTSDRFQHPYFRFLSTIVARRLDLDFDLNTLSYYTKDRIPVTNYYVTDNSKFLFIDKQIITEYLLKNDYELIWVKNISKYGDFGIHHDSKLNPSFKDFKVTKCFSDL